MGDYTVAIWATVGLVILFTVPVVWQFMQPNDDDFGDLTRSHANNRRSLKIGDCLDPGPH